MKPQTITNLRKFRILLALLTVGLLLAVGSRGLFATEVAQAARQGQENERRRLLEEPIRRLVEMAQATGAVDVIVGLEVPAEDEDPLAPNTRQAARPSVLAQAQDEVLRLLPTHDPISVKKFAHVPYVAMRLDAAGVVRLLEIQKVVSVFEDTPVPPSLAESTAVIGAPQLWAKNITGAGQTIAILDTGVEASHPFLTGKVISEACYSGNQCPGGTTSIAPGSGKPCDPTLPDCGHGTHVAGIAAGKGSSFSGVAKDANLISIQVFTRVNDTVKCKGKASCALSFPSDQVLALERVYDLRNSYKIAAVNMSLGGGQYFTACDSGNPLKDIIDKLRAAKIATVIASGNDSYKNAIAFPACTSTAISVGATGDGSGGATLDGVGSFSNSSTLLSFLAPGGMITSSVIGGGFSASAGTSMAAPHVAGAWALLKQQDINASVDQVRLQLFTTGKNITDVNNVTKPRINLGCAYTVTPSATSFPNTAASGTIQVTTTATCPWRAAVLSNTPWITVSNNSTTGNGSVSFTMQPYGGMYKRTATLVVAGKLVTIKQAGWFDTPIPYDQTLYNQI